METLPAVTLQSTLLTTPPFKTVTETFSTKELMIKESILPVIQGKENLLPTTVGSFTLRIFTTRTAFDFFQLLPFLQASVAIDA